jgi:hypothetical protein
MLFSGLAEGVEEACIAYRLLKTLDDRPLGMI